MITGTEFFLLQKYDPTNPKFQEALQASVSAVTKQALPSHQYIDEAAYTASQEALELLAAQERADKIIELAKQTQKGKTK